MRRPPAGSVRRSPGRAYRRGAPKKSRAESVCPLLCSEGSGGSPLLSRYSADAVVAVVKDSVRQNVVRFDD